MQNRLNVARALLNRPKLLFLDEPTSGLDPVNARRIRDLIKNAHIETIHTQETTLEQIFIDVTGRGLQ